VTIMAVTLREVDSPRGTGVVNTLAVSSVV